MSRTAAETLGTFGVGILCVVLGIMVLAIFFMALNWLATQGAKPEPMAVRGIIKKDTWVTVHMSGAETFDRVRFVGFTSTQSIKSHIPYDLDGMVILEEESGKRYFVRAKAIRMIVIAPEGAGGAMSG
jgi:hypothetical protein